MPSNLPKAFAQWCTSQNQHFNRIFMSFDRNVMTENVAKVNFQHAPLSEQLRFHPLLPQRRYPVPDKEKKNNPTQCINTTVQQCTACLRWF